MATRDQKCNQIFLAFKFLSYKHKKKLAKFIYTYDPSFLVEYRDGVYASMHNMGDEMIEHIYHYIQANTWCDQNNF